MLPLVFIPDSAYLSAQFHFVASVHVFKHVMTCLACCVWRHENWRAKKAYFMRGKASSTLEATCEARRKEMGPVSFVYVTLHRTLLSMQCVQDCCYNRICTS